MSEPTGQVSKADHDQAIADLQATHDKELKSLREESAKYRSQRNQALRRGSALETIAKAHQIDLSKVTDEALEALPIVDGRVDGEFAYEVPSLRPPGATERKPRVTDGGKGQLTKEALSSMSVAEIRALPWDQVRAALAA